MRTEAKYKSIYQKLLTEIVEGKYLESRKLPSEGQLVKRFKASRPTVAKALRDLQLDGLIERKVGSGNFLRKGPRRVGLKRQEQNADRQIGMLIPELASLDFFATICGEFAGVARIHNFGVLWGSVANTPQGAEPSMLPTKEVEKICESFVKKKVAGVLFAPMDGAGDEMVTNERVAQRLAKASIPMVLLDRDIVRFPQRSNFDLVALDNFRAGFLLTEHLIKLGLSRLAFFSRPHSADAIDQRYLGMLAALCSRQIKVVAKSILVGDPSDIDGVRELGLERRFEAIICANDLTAGQLQRSLSKLGLQIPRDLRIAAFDDTRLASLLPVPLTTIRQPAREIASIAFRALHERILSSDLPARCLLATPQLIVRESCGAYLKI